MFMLFRNSFRYASMLAVLVYAGGCSSEKPQEETPAADTTAVEVSGTSDVMSFESIFYSLPSPIVVASSLKESGAQFTESLLNKPDNASKYSTNFSKAVNLGVYGTDLSYACFFNQSQATISYMDAARKVADGIGLGSVFESDQIYYRFQSNLGNRDSLLLVIADMISGSDEYLKENEKFSTAALVIAGGWIEGLYLATTQTKGGENKAIVNQIGTQGIFVQKLSELLDKFKDEPEFTPLIADVNSIKETFAKITVETSAGESTTDPNASVTVIGGESKANVSKEVLDELTNKVKEIRTKLIKP